jgi:hypothetical protein
MEPRALAPSTRKVRRDGLGGKRGDGHLRTQRIRRADARRIRITPSEHHLTGVAGLAAFGAFSRQIGVERELRRRFERLKTAPQVVYPMAAQMRLLIDAAVVGEDRVFGLEALAADPLFVQLAGGVVPSIDTVYRDLCRFDDLAIEHLEELVAEHGLALLQGRKLQLVHLDIDTTVEPLFGSQEGALPGPNPRYHGRPSYHPILARVAEVDAVVGALLRPGDTAFGADAVPFIERCIDRVRAALGPEVVIYVRIDGAADCTAILDAVTARKAFIVTKARMTADLCGTVSQLSAWKTVDVDADGKPRVQVAEVPFARTGWPGRAYRVVAVRTRDRLSGKQIFLWKDLDFTVQIFITNEWHEPLEDVARRYDLRAGIEPLIGELKHAWAMGKVPSQCFAANHAAMLLKLLAFNLLRRFLAASCVPFPEWRAAWVRRAIINVPGRLSKSGRSRILRVPATSALARMLN